MYLNKTVGYQLLIFQAHPWVGYKVPIQSDIHYSVCYILHTNIITDNLQYMLQKVHTLLKSHIRRHISIKHTCININSPSGVEDKDI